MIQIGVTGGAVKTRIADAALDATYLFADVEAGLYKPDEIGELAASVFFAGAARPDHF